MSTTYRGYLNFVHSEIIMNQLSDTNIVMIDADVNTLSGTCTTIQADVDANEAVFTTHSGNTDYHYVKSSISIADLGTKDHDLLDGLGNDDHTQYTRVDGSRGFINGWTGTIPTISGTITVASGIITDYS